MKAFKFAIFCTIALMTVTGLNSCKKKKKDETPEPVQKNSVPEFYLPALESDYGKNSPLFIVVADNSVKVSNPQDLAFNPTRLNELWVVNKGTDATGGSTVMIANAATPSQTFDFRTDDNAWHFMPFPSALAFSNNGNWATSHNILDANRGSDLFAGPSLWSGDLNIYARPSGGNGSHLDMLHSSPFGMGIESERDNIFWLFDGYNGHIVRFDFFDDHGPGNHDHSDGRVHRYTEVQVKRDPLVPSHLVLDKDKKWLYIADGGNKRILRMDITTGSKLSDLQLINEPLAQHWEMSGVNWEEFVPATAGLQSPSGIAIADNRLFVSDFATGEIICYDVSTKLEISRIQTNNPGITGLAIAPDNLLWYVNGSRNEVVRIIPK